MARNTHTHTHIHTYTYTYTKSINNFNFHAITSNKVSVDAFRLSDVNVCDYTEDEIPKIKGILTL